jgi:hypothetical protein
MLHQFFDKRPWFASKTFGYGAGLPIAWQGWLLVFSYSGLMIGTGMIAANASAGLRGAAVVMLFVATAIFVTIVYRRTEGGWHWRWGKRD